MKGVNYVENWNWFSVCLHIIPTHLHLLWQEAGPLKKKGRMNRQRCSWSVSLFCTLNNSRRHWCPRHKYVFCVTYFSRNESRQFVLYTFYSNHPPFPQGYILLFTQAEMIRCFIPLLIHPSIERYTINKSEQMFQNQ